MRTCALPVLWNLPELTSDGIRFITRAFSDLLKRDSKCHTYTSVLEPTCSSSMYLPSSCGRCSTSETV